MAMYFLQFICPQCKGLSHWVSVDCADPERERELVYETMFESQCTNSGCRYNHLFLGAEAVKIQVDISPEEQEKA